jgi:WD40 repeat protein
MACTAAGRDSAGNLRVWDEESGQLHRELEGFGAYCSVEALATFLSPDGQQPRLVAGSAHSQLRVYDPESGSVLHHLRMGRDFTRGHSNRVADLACIASSSAAPHHPRVVSAVYAGAAQVWNGETGELLADLGDHDRGVTSVVVWKEHTGGHDRIATAEDAGRVRVWDGEAFTLLHDLDCASALNRLLVFESTEGPARLLVAPRGVEPRGLRLWDPEEGRLLHDGINEDCPFIDWHLLESAQGRHLLAITGKGPRHPRHPGDTIRPFLDVWDLGQAPARAGLLKPAHHVG